MKHFVILTTVALVALSLSVVSATLTDAQPLQAEQNFRLLKKTMETSDDLLDAEASGDYFYDDDEDYEYDEELGSGDEMQSFDEDETKLEPDNMSDDIHFADKEANGNNNDDKDNDYLYEYYSEQDNWEGDYVDEADYVGAVDKSGDSVDDVATVDNDDESHIGLSYIFLVLASSLVSFVVFVLAFILCQRSFFSRQKKTTTMTLDIAGPLSPVKSTPIVKSYQLVPTSTKEFMQSQRQHTAVNVSGNLEPLLE